MTSTPSGKSTPSAGQARRGVLFDVDGTLIDSSYLHTVAWWHAFNQAGHDVPMHRIHRLIGMGSEQLIDELLPDGRDKDGDDAIGAAHGALFSVHWPGLKPTRGATELLRRCADAGLVVVLASSSNVTEVAAMREALGTDDILTAVTTATDAEHSKPEPDIFAAALEAGDLRPENTIVVGDARWDVESAWKLGLDAVCVACGGISETELRGAGAVDVYADPQELLDNFEGSPLGRLAAGG